MRSSSGEEGDIVHRAIQRKLIWDLLPCPHQPHFISSFGLVPGGEDGDMFEHRASHRRLNRTYPVIDSLRLISSVAGDVLGRAILEGQGIDAESVAGMSELEQHVQNAIAVSIAVVANLLEYEILELGEGMVGE